MDAHRNELLLDLEEVQKFEGLAQRESVRAKLAVWRSQIEQELSELKRKFPSQGTEAAQTTKSQPKLFTKKITTYAWDQSDKFVKIYVSGLKGIQSIPKENVSLNFNDHHYVLDVANLNNSNYRFNVPKLLHDVGDSSVKIKTDEVVIMFRKAENSRSWETLSEKEKREMDEKKRRDEPKLDKNADPSKGIMDMMKKMYDEGDSEMKRTIAKAWTESRDKQMSGESGLEPEI